jgi:hypothetical protein
MLNTGAVNGSVDDYNFAILDFGDDSTYNFNSHGDHTGGTDFCLNEGNIGSLYLADLIHGTHNTCTLFRNRYSATMPVCWVSSTNTSTPDLALSTGTFGACTYFGNAIALDPFSRGYNIVGNVLGNGTWSPFNTSYENNSTENSYAIYRLGAGYDGIPTDANVPAMTLIYGNVDIQNNSSLVAEKSFCGKSTNTGWNSSVIGYRNCSATSEIPTGLTGARQPYFSYVPEFGDTAAGQNALPTSLYYTSKPSWWPSGKAWPPIGPDVTGGNISGTGGFANTNPAEDCYTNVMSGPSNGAGTVLSFNADTCYAASGSVTLSPTSENFGSVNVGSSSSPITFTLTNNSSTTATSVSPSVSGGNSGDFSITNSGTGSCAAASGSITTGHSCTFTVTFTPGATGSRSTTLSVSYSGGDGASPQTSALSGTGNATGSVSLSPSSKNFGTITVGSASTGVTFTLSNTTGSSVTGITVTFTGGNTGDFVNLGSGTCTSTLAASSSCTIIATFNPTAAGSRSTTLNVADSASSSPQQSSLSGTGIVSVTAPAAAIFGILKLGPMPGQTPIPVLMAASARLSVLDQSRQPFRLPEARATKALARPVG